MRLLLLLVVMVLLLLLALRVRVQGGGKRSLPQSWTSHPTAARPISRVARRRIALLATVVVNSARCLVTVPRVIRAIFVLSFSARDAGSASSLLVHTITRHSGTIFSFPIGHS